MALHSRHSGTAEVERIMYVLVPQVSYGLYQAQCHVDIKSTKLESTKSLLLELGMVCILPALPSNHLQTDLEKLY